MRKFLVTAFAAAAAFTVLANNFIPVTAPEIGDHDGSEFSATKHSAPSGVARLSDQKIAVAVKEVQVAPVAVRYERVPDRILSVTPDLSEFEPHETATRQASITPAPKVRPSNHFLTAWTEVPLAAFNRMKLLVSPEPPAIDLLASAGQVHSVDSVAAVAPHREAIAVAADLSRAGDTTAIAVPLDSISTAVAMRELADVPSAPVGAGILAGYASEHQAARSESAEIVRVDDEFVPDEPAPVLPVFITAAFQSPVDVFQRARFVAEPVAPISPDALSEQTAQHSNDNKQETIHRFETDAPAETPSAFGLPAFVTAIAELPVAIFDRQRLAPEPAAPVSVDVLASAAEHTSESSANIASIQRNSEVSPDAAAPILPDFITAVAEAPIAAFQKMGLIEMPSAPVSTNSLIEANLDHIANVAANPTQFERAMPAPDSVAVAPAPILITSNVAVSNEILKPMSAGPLPDAPLVNENAVAGNYTNATPFDRMFAEPDMPAAIAKAQPVLISGSPSFSMDLLKPMNSAAAPFIKIDNDQVAAAMLQRDGFCDPNFVGPPIRFSQTVQLKLEDLINQLHQRFGVNFIVGKGVGELPMNIKAGSIPWNTLLKSQLFISGVRARCIDANTVELIQNADIGSLQDMADVETRFVKLKFLQRTGSGTVDLANRSQGGQSGNQGGGCGGNNQGGQSSGAVTGGGGGGGGQQGQTAGQLSNNKFDKLVVEIEKILGLRSMNESSGGDSGSGGSQQQQTDVIRTNRFVTQIPGRNILAIRATKEEHDLITQIIVRADRPPFQVVIKGLVYTANQDRLRDIGVQTTITGGTADGRSTGGIFGDTLGVGTLFDFSTVIGTFDFNVQATAFQQNGVISVKGRPFATVIDGLCTTLDVGRQLPIVIDSTLGGQGDVVFVNAANNLAVTPYVIDDDNGNPIAVTLELRLTANDIDSSVTARGVPAISARSIQTQLLLEENKTAILGGFTVDSDSRTVQKTPGLGDIPIIGELFKRRIRDTRMNRLYFAIAVDVIPYPQAIRPVDVPGATTDIPSITPEQKKRADAAEPKQVKGP